MMFDKDNKSELRNGQYSDLAIPLLKVWYPIHPPITKLRDTGLKHSGIPGNCERFELTFYMPKISLKLA